MDLSCLVSEIRSRDGKWTVEWINGEQGISGPEGGPCNKTSQLKIKQVDVINLCKKHSDKSSGLSWGLPSHAIHFWKALVEPMLRPI